MAKLADALDLGSSVRKDVWVQVPPSAPNLKDPLSGGSFFTNAKNSLAPVHVVH